MKYTKKQKEAIIKKAIKELRKGHVSGLCWAITLGMNETRTLSIPMIQRIFPQFKESVAIKYFKAAKTISSSFWWMQNERENGHKNRIKFLQYLLDGKLPKKVSKKK